MDVFLNNTEYGVTGTLEAATTDQVRGQYNVTFFEAIDCIKSILPYFKKNKRGTIIN
ncbi:hypothetical protein D7Z94_05200 [Ulvibacterium marinum]|uniref:Uncharacterized protein n=1 Tax=Ulvibacterium marinum TaxID=2419782 RepID=A0A3B0CDB5_9FLAO|nr:hypothetical protein D7Z94_05200 [Ulvibacterium marinum]